MTKEEALQEFFSSFDLESFVEYTVPTGEDAPGFPYLTYSFTTDDFGVQVALYADLWYRDTSWVSINAKTQEIGDRLGRGGVMIPCDGGAIWLKRGQPFAQSMGDEDDDTIRRKHLNITAEFIT